MSGRDSYKLMSGGRQMKLIERNTEEGGGHANTTTFTFIGQKCLNHLVYFPLPPTHTSNPDMEENNEEKKIVIVRHPEGALVECEMPECPNKTAFPFKFCESCQILAERIEFVADFLGYMNPNRL